MAFQTFGEYLFVNKQKHISVSFSRQPGGIQMSGRRNSDSHDPVAEKRQTVRDQISGKSEFFICLSVN